MNKLRLLFCIAAVSIAATTDTTPAQATTATTPATAQPVAATAPPTTGPAQPVAVTSQTASPAPQPTTSNSTPNPQVTQVAINRIAQQSTINLQQQISNALSNIQGGAGGSNASATVLAALCPSPCYCSAGNPIACVTCKDVGRDPKTSCMQCLPQKIFVNGLCENPCAANCLCKGIIPNVCTSCVDVAANISQRCNACNTGYRKNPKGVC